MSTPMQPDQTQLTIPAPADQPISPFPDPDKHLSKRVRVYRKMHDAARDVMPKAYLATHRYWIAVVHPGTRAGGPNPEKRYTWFKGNRLITGYTIRKFFEQKTMIDDFVLLLGDMLIDDGDRMEQLDLLNTKIIVLRCVMKRDPASKGVAVTHGLVPEPKAVIEEKQATRVVIEID